MRVLFLALGGNRKRAALAESRAMAERGDRVVVLISGRRAWAKESFAPGIEVVALDGFRRHWPLAAEHLVVFRGPRFLLRRIAGYGTERADRALSAYDRVFANRAHRFLISSVYGRLWRDGAHRQIDAFLRRYGMFDAVVVADTRSVPSGLRVAEQAQARTGTPPRVAFRVEPLLATAAAGPASPEEAT